MSDDRFSQERCIDAEVAGKIMGYKDPDEIWDYDINPDGDKVGDGVLEEVPHFSTDMTSAWEIAKKFSLCVIPVKDGYIVGYYDLKDEYLDILDGVIDGHLSKGYMAGCTAPLAICLAALEMQKVIDG